MVEIPLGVEMLEDVDEDFGGDMRHGGMGVGGHAGVGVVDAGGPLCGRDDGGERAGKDG